MGGALSALLWLKESPAIQQLKENPDKYGNLENLSNLNTLKNDLFAIDLFFIYVKLFKYLNFNRTMAQLNNTMNRVSKLLILLDICQLNVFFFVFSVHGIF